MNLSDFSIRHSVFTWMLLAALVLFGGIAFFRMGVSEMPDVDFPVLTVQLNYQGAAPEVMEADVVDLVEESVMTVQGIRGISSSARQSQATVTIEFELGRNIDAAVQEVQAKLAQAAQQLPKDLDPPIVLKVNPDDQPILWISLTGDRPLPDIMAYARDHLKDQLQTVTGVGDVFLGGYIPPALRVWIDPVKLAAHELTAQDVLDAITREHAEVPAGHMENDTTEINIRAMGEARTPQEFAQILIGRRGAQSIFTPIRLGDVARVEMALDDTRRLSRTQGTPSVGLGIRKQRGTNAVRVADAAKARLAQLQKALPPGLGLVINFDSTRFIRATTQEMKFHLVLSALLTGIVCLLFLASIRSTFNILLAMPASIVGAFLFLYLFGFTLNTFTFLGLILAIGIVVDDAIMVLENIVRHREMGKDAWTAAADGAREIGPAAIATTLALIAVFVPVVFMPGAIGTFFYQFGMTITVTVALSLLAALTLTPMLCARVLVHEHADGRWAQVVNRWFGALMTHYRRLLARCLRHRGLVIGGAALLFVGSLFLLLFVPKEFVPAQDQSMLLARFQTPVGSSIDFTDAQLVAVDKIIATHPEVEHSFFAIGGFGGGEINTGMMFLTLQPPAKRPVVPSLGHRPSQQEIMEILRKETNTIPNLRASFQDLSMRGFAAQRGYPVEFTVRGPEWDKLADIAQQLVTRMKQNPFFVDVDTDYQMGQPEIEILPRRAAAAERGVSVADIGHVIDAMIGGVRAGKFSQGGHRNDIRVRVEAVGRQTSDDILRLSVRNRYGELVSMRDLVDVHEVKTLNTITRRDRERAVGVFANVGRNHAQAAALEEVNRLAKDIVPDGYRVVFTGSAQAFTEAFQSLIFALWLGIIVAYMVLGSQYNSFIHPLTVLLALPLSISGAWLALFLTHKSLNMFSFIGVILLMGIAKKNSILLVDFANQRRREGLPLNEALLTACPARLRPILMTSLATIAAAIPPALGIGPGSETRIPMAMVVIGGVMLSTILTLFVVPCAYSVMARWEKPGRAS